MIDLQAHAPEELARALACDITEARKIASAVHRDKWTGAPVTGVRRVTMDRVRAEGRLQGLAVVAEEASKLDPFVKYALKTHDEKTIETVRIPLEKQGRFSVCVSSQVGCALACSFCATGKLGLLRNLEPWEIVEQVRIVRRGLVERGLGRVHGVVFQGMGEPMANLDRVLAAIRVMSDPSCLAIDARAMTVSTAGIPSGIRRLAREAPKVRLAISIGSARKTVRRSLMPIDAAHALEEVIEACVEHAKATGLAPMWAVTPLAGVNDSEADAHALADLATSFAERAGVRPRVSVIPYNSIGEGDPYVRTTEGNMTAFRASTVERGLHTHRRYSGGGDVAAACGQLAGRAAPIES